MTDYPDLCNNESSCQKPELLKRISELEDALEASEHFRDVEGKQLAELEATIERVRELPKRWHSREFPFEVGYADDIPRQATLSADFIVDVCADELEEALNNPAVSPETIAAIKCVTGQNNE